MSASTSGPRSTGVRPVTLWVMILCSAAIAFDGFDLLVYGTVVPSLLAYETWGLTPEQVGFIGSAALVGMLFGAMSVGTVSDLIGRRKVLIVCVTWFSVFTGLIAVVPTPELFGLFRFLAGLGLGGLVPTASTLTLESVPEERRNLYYLTMMTGYNAGGLLAALLAVPIIPALGWRAMFVIALLPLLLIVPLMLKFLPESVSFLLMKGRKAEAEALANRYGIALEHRTGEPTTGDGERALNPLSTMLSRNYFVGTLAFWIMAFMGLLLIYGLTTWLPQIMIESGYALGSALSFLVVLNIGAIVGRFFAGAAADRFGTRLVCGLAFLAVAGCLGLLSVSLPMLLTYAIVALAGIGTFSAQDLINAHVGEYYPTNSRATALGWTLGVGRLGAICGPVLGGLIVGAQLAVPWGFYAYALPGLLAALIVLLLLPRSPRLATPSARSERVEVSR